LKNNQYFYYRKLDYKTKEYYSYFTKVNKSKLDSLIRIYIKKETTNIIEVDSKFDSSQYSILTIKILILVLNSKDKKILENILINYRVTILLINLKTIKEEKYQIEAILYYY
jgi:hypothetical protein